jgi:hypothetical protein
MAVMKQPIVKRGLVGIMSSCTGPSQRRVLPKILSRKPKFWFGLFHITNLYAKMFDMPLFGGQESCFCLLGTGGIGWKVWTRVPYVREIVNLILGGKSTKQMLRNSRRGGRGRENERDQKMGGVKKYPHLRNS